MFRRIFALVFLVVHLNGSMLLPQVAEADLCRAGLPADDLNTVVEFLAEKLMAIQDLSPDDEDEDGGQAFYAVRSIDGLFTGTQVLEPLPLPDFKEGDDYRSIVATGLWTLPAEIPTPPPQQASC